MCIKVALLSAGIQEIRELRDNAVVLQQELRACRRNWWVFVLMSLLGFAITVVFWKLAWIKGWVVIFEICCWVANLFMLAGLHMYLKKKVSDLTKMEKEAATS